MPERHAELEELARDLASADPMAEYDNGAKFCMFCYGEESGGRWKSAPAFFWAPEMKMPRQWVPLWPLHDETCVWARARKLVPDA